MKSSRPQSVCVSVAFLASAFILAFVCGCGGDPSVKTTHVKPKTKRTSHQSGKKPSSSGSSSKKRASNSTPPKKKRRKRLGLSATPPKRQVLTDPGGFSPGTSGSMPTITPAAGSVEIRERTEELLEVVKDSLKYGPTLVVWVFDNSPSARPLVQEVTRSVQSFYQGRGPQITPGKIATDGEDDSEKKNTSKGDDSKTDVKLVSSLITFGKEATFVIDQPTASGDQLLASMTDLKFDGGGKEMAFTAIEKATKRYRVARVKERRAVIFAVVTDEVGDDSGLVEAAITIPKKYEMPVYVIGPNAPFGQAAAMDQSSERVMTQDNEPPRRKRRKRNQRNMMSSRPTGPIVVRSGPESRHSEVIQLEFTGSDSIDVDLDSGFGPFAWEWLCRESGGRYLGVARAKVGASYDRRAMRRLAPKYYSEDKYQQMLESNAACRAVHNVARLPFAQVLQTPTLRFVRKDEASLKRALDAAQTQPATLEPALRARYDVLRKGERERNRLTDPRWQANFDLAMGRTLAAIVRTEGYNAMLAVLERGKTFSDSSHTTWVLESNDGIEEAGSSMKNFAKKAKEYLNRVIEEHPNTPWAALAQYELNTPIGWKWSEQ